MLLTAYSAPKTKGRPTNAVASEPAGKKTSIKLTKCQGLNDPKVPVAWLRERNQLNELYTKAASHLRELVSPPSPPPTLTGKRFDLTILKRNGTDG